MIFGVNKQQAETHTHILYSYSTYINLPGGPFTGLVLALFERRRTLIFRNEFVYVRRMDGWSMGK